VSESFFSRWSRQKRAAAESLAPATPAVPPVAEPGQVQQPQAEAASATPALPQTQAPAPLPTLDDVGALTPESDFQPFMQRGVGAEVRNAAMKKLFADPHFNVMDGLDIYIDDYSQPDPLPASMLRKMASAQFLKLVPEEAPAQTPVRPAAAGAGGDTDPLPSGETKVVAQSPDSSACADTPSHDHPDLQLQPDPAPADPQPGPGPR
jgi:hypothetical protein